MGDYFQTLVDVQAGPDEAERLARDVLDWLVASGVVAAGRTDCVLGADLGHPPGPRADAVLDGEGYPSWRDLWTNGLDIATGRSVFDAGQGEPSAVSCPHCATTIELVDEGYELVREAWEPFGEAMTEWSEGRDGIIACPACTRAVEPAAWRWADDYFAFGHLGFTFWNWPPLRPEFVAEFTRRLAGHRTVLLDGKL
ncbi:hypothetical protein [Spirillospora sp. NPDC048819]|uniref:hypothetical protein n=1 Tax=Spirillospora sp. NPDC048819 TaxID=3155268 RepID=UPI0033D5E53E